MAGRLSRNSYRPFSLKCCFKIASDSISFTLEGFKNILFVHDSRYIKIGSVATSSPKAKFRKHRYSLVKRGQGKKKFGPHIWVAPLRGQSPQLSHSPEGTRSIHLVYRGDSRC